MDFRPISTFLLPLFFLTALTLSGQDKNFPWQVTLGTSVIDPYPAGPITNGPLGNQGEMYEDAFNVREHWNFGGLTLSASRFIASGFSVGIGTSITTLNKIGGNPDVDIPYFSFEGFFKFSPLYKTKLTPYVLAGFGYSRIDTQDVEVTSDLTSNFSTTLVGSLGLNYKLNDQLGLFLESSYRNVVGRAGISHLHHQIGIGYTFGQSKDTDGDGVNDADDVCPQVPGLEKYKGCPDTDGDGVPDKDDECPQDAGKPELKGCPDTDGDGVPDKDDACPNVMGDAAMNGCPDADGDSVPDGEDEIPLETVQDPQGDAALDVDEPLVQKANSTGAPKISDKIIETLNLLGSKIVFPSESDAIFGRQNLEALQEIKKVLDDNPDGQLIIEGYSSSDGSEDFNKELSEKRAVAVKTYLIGLGVNSNRLEVIGYGEAQPLESNESMVGRAANRRVQFRAKF